MNLISYKLNANYEDTGYENNPNYLAHEEEPVDFYRKYKDSDFRPVKGGKNLHNLFSDSDVKDYYWLKIARKYLRKN